MSNIVAPDAFFEFFKPIVEQIEIALDAKNRPGLPPQLIAVQAAIETGWSPSGCNQGNPGWDGALNFSGLSYNKRILSFSSITAYVAAYVEAITQSIYSACFTELPAAIAHLAASDWRTYVPLEMRAAIALGESPWAGGHYESTVGGQPGSSLEAILTANENLLNQLFPPPTRLKTDDGAGETDATILVTAGETLTGIAQDHHEALAQLEADNPQITDPNLLTIGEKITVDIPPVHTVHTGTTDPASAAPKTPDEIIYHLAKNALVGNGSRVTLESLGMIAGLHAYRIQVWDD